MQKPITNAHIDKLEVKRFVLAFIHSRKLQTDPWHREEEPQNNHETPGRQTKQRSQVFLPHQDDCNWTQSNTQQNIEQLQNSAMGASTNNETTAAEPPPQNGQQPNPLVCVCVCVCVGGG